MNKVFLINPKGPHHSGRKPKEQEADQKSLRSYKADKQTNIR